MVELPEALDELRKVPRWVMWRYVDGRKVPISPNGGNAKANDPNTWGTFEQVSQLCEAMGCDGIGFELGAGYYGVDLDDAIDEAGELKDWALEIIEQLGSYAEWSPSQTGVHVIAKADPHVVGRVGRNDHARGIEVYNHGRYFTMTGDELPQSGALNRDPAALTKFLKRHFNGDGGSNAAMRKARRLAGEQVKRSADKTMIDSAKRDHRRFARVPQGPETCTFCMMLASRGFVYHTAETAAALGHTHNDCDCKVVVEPMGGKVDGYDPDALYDVWKRFEGIDADKSVPPAERKAAKRAIVEKIYE